MIKPHWSPLALAGLSRFVQTERVESARSAIDLKLMYDRALALRRLSAFPARNLHVFTQFAGKTLRVVVEIESQPIVWHVGLQHVESTE